MSYAWGSKKHKIKVVPDLWKGIAMLSSLVLLAGRLDTEMRVDQSQSTESVTWLEIQTAVDPTFLPSRGIPEQCLNASHYTQGRGVTGCNIEPSGPRGGGGLVNRSEYIRVSSGQSTINAVYLADGQAVLGPASIQVNDQGYFEFDFQVTSFGSNTTCKMVTRECGTHQTDPGGSDAAPDLAFACNASTAGLELRGNFSDVYQSSARSSEEGNSSNTLSSQTGIGNYQMGFQYYNNSAKTRLSTANGPEDLGASTLYWAFVFALHAGFASTSYSEDTPEYYNNQGSNLFNDLDLAGLPGTGLGGIMSCQTQLSDVLYNYSSSIPKITIVRSTPLNRSAPLIFLGPLSNSYGFQQLYTGINTAAANASTPDELASLFATAYDQTIIAMPAGTFTHLPPVTIPTGTMQYQVTRVPRAPFLALVILDLIYAVLGIALTIMALVVVAKGDGVRDAQARLSIGALVAESFESPVLGEDARDVSELFAERRGLGQSARRIALGKRGTPQGTKPALPGESVGGRRYRQVVWATRKGEGGGMAVI
ncbi:MAG: hypothetical protein OHK93_001636 [Ramalina farinacea]|uniref:Uncharacterized protein n=1 Tax=Ramalina farinacea TaxID=258253 RepID=A0AA43QT88_9LECA|nr:hypothetical protein [Ramalina farinacea]